MEISSWQIAAVVFGFTCLGVWAIVVTLCLKNGDRTDAELCKEIERLSHKLYNSIESQNRLLDYLGLKEVTTIESDIWSRGYEKTELVKKEKNK